MWVGLIRPVEGLMSKNRFLEKKPCLPLQPAGLPTDLRLASLHNCVSQFLKINIYK